MNIINIPIEQVTPSSLNSNVMDDRMRAKLKRSIEEFGLVNPTVVRPMEEGSYETIGGAHRLEAARELGYTTVPCVVIEADDAQALLLSQALNRIHGEDDLGLKAQTLKRVLEDIPRGDVLRLLPETEESLKALSNLGTQSLAEGLLAWNEAQKVKLKHLTFQMTDEQLQVVERSLSINMPGTARMRSNLNKRGSALYQLCQDYLQLRNNDDQSKGDI